MSFITGLYKLVQKKRHPHEVIRLSSAEKNSIAAVIGSCVTIAIVTGILIVLN